MTASLLTKAHSFERGDKVYLTMPLVLCSPSQAQVEEFAFASAVKTMAPNENIGWLQGRYVEAGKANLNGAMWLSDEIGLKSLTPMLMPVTVMHDPRTAVGTIADCKLFAEDRSRLETVLAIWRHRFGDVWEEAQANINDGTMMQSMECLSPWYTCSDCGETYVKLAKGAEQASWCDHLRNNSSCRILQDVCFTGTGLIFGSRGGQGAYTEAYLDHFQDEIAEYHERAHIDGRYRAREEPTKMGFVQIDETELSGLRSDRDKYKADADRVSTENRDLTAKAEKAEAEATKERAEREKAEADAAALKEQNERAVLKDKRWSDLGAGFIAKLGEVTRGRLAEQAGTMSDEDWTARLSEVEEMSGVKRDASVTTAPAAGAAPAETSSAFGESFSEEEMASFRTKGVTAPTTVPTGDAGRKLARALKPVRPKSGAGASN